MKTIETYLRSIIITGLFAVPFLAFVVASNLFFPFITGKNFGFRIIVEVIFTAYFLLAYYNAEYRPKFSWIMAVASIFVAVVFFADLFGVNSYRSFWSNYERMEGFVGLIHVFAYFIVAGSVLSKDLWTKFWHTSVWASIVMSFYGIMQLTGSAEISQSSVRLDGRFGNAAYFGGYLLFNIFLIAFLMAKRKQRDFLWYLYAGAIALETYMVFSTETRGSILGLFVGIIITSLLFIFFDKKHPFLKWLSVGTIAVVFIFISSVFYYKDSAFVRDHSSLSRFSSISLEQAGPRFMVWGMALQGFKERPLLGWGQENFNIVFNKYYDPGMFAQEQWFDRAHDIFFDWLIAAGIFGLLGYLLLFISGVFLSWETETPAEGKGVFAQLRHFWRQHRSGDEQDKILERSILTGLFASYFVHNIFVFDNLASYILFFSLLAYLHHSHVRKFPVLVPKPKVTGKKSEPSEDPLPFSYIGTTVLFVFCFVFYFVNVRPIMANQEILTAIATVFENGTLGQSNLDAFKKAIGYGTFGNSEAREQLVQTAVKVKTMDLSDTIKKDFSVYARDQILAQIEKSPGDARYETFAGMLFYRYGDVTGARTHYETAHELSPKKQTISFYLIESELNLGENDKAVALAKSTYESEPKFDEAAVVYATTLMRTGKTKESSTFLVEHFGTDLVANDGLVNAYYLSKQYGKVIAILTKKLAENDDQKIRLRLAAVYSEIGDNKTAIAEIQKIIDKNPSFKAQGEGYIKEIKAGMASQAR